MNRLALAASFCSLAICVASTANPARAQAPKHGLDLAAIDKSVKPCENFYKFANGRWLAETKIPAEYSDWGSFSILYEHNLAVEKHLVDDAAAKFVVNDSAESKVGMYYRSFMDTTAIDAAGVKPLQPYLDRIAALKDTSGLIAEIGKLHQLSDGAAFVIYVEQDPRASDREILSISQGGFSLPERGYYERTDRPTTVIRTAYVEHITRVFALLGESPESAAASAATVMSIETKLAKASKYPADLRDPVANYHLMTLSQLEKQTPGMDWKAFFSAIAEPHPGPIDVNQPEFFTTFATLLHSIPIADWKTYLRWKLIDQQSRVLSREFDEEHFHFYSTILNGTLKQKPRWKRGIDEVDGALGEALGQLYVRENFPPSAKARALSLVQNLKAVLRDDLVHLPWMSAATRKQAIVKLDAMAIKIGYPDRWRDYSLLNVDSPYYIVNAMRAHEFEFQRQLNKIGKPVDHKEWGMSPPTVNAFYDPDMNDIDFPAGILQAPFFDVDADDAVNYGAIGTVIGHEMTHGFDDQGRQYDAHGNLHNWWTGTDLAAFNSRAKGIVAQYSSYSPIDKLHINGSLTQGENIADIGGLKIAYLALERSLKGKPHSLIQGYTPEQRFFISFAQIWRHEHTAESARVNLATDPHSPAEYRVTGVLADTPEFRKAWGCPPDRKSKATVIW